MLFLDLSTWGRVYCLPVVGVDWMFYTHRPHPLASGLSLPPMQLHDDNLVKSEFSAYMMVIWKDFFCPLPNSGSQFNSTGERPIIPKPRLHPRSRKSSNLPLFLLTLPWMFYFCSHTYLLFFFLIVKTLSCFWLLLVAAAVGTSPWHSPAPPPPPPLLLAAQGCLLQISAELCPGAVFFQVTLAAHVQGKLEVVKVTSLRSPRGSPGWDTSEAVPCCLLGSRSRLRWPQ